ncbi:F-box/RNI superfamily protein, putative [Medicago truncatula]|uniref:F-box/RNI superfamily protein, putative n=1 Tax=Medicago truncatula TaxID=3880 RepID=G7JYI9_MEDTR|nr:F-box/RNI superfamily protein, putative [Medicago truncatula]
MNVKHLIMKTALHHFEFVGVSFMLRSCPYLERLTIEIVDERRMVMKQCSMLSRRDTGLTLKVYKCVKKRLKEIEIKSFKGTKNEFTNV